ARAMRPTWVTADGAPLVNPVGTATAVAAIDSLTVTFTHDLLASAAGNAANYSLGAAGPDATFGTADDTTYVLTPSYAGVGSRVVNFSIAPNPLQPGTYRFRTLPGL